MKDSNCIRNMPIKKSSSSKVVKSRGSAKFDSPKHQRRFKKSNSEVKFLYEGEDKCFRGDLDTDALISTFESRGLLESTLWTKDDHTTVANLVVGRRFKTDMSLPTGRLLKDIHGRIYDEAEKSSYLTELLDPFTLVIATLPHQAVNSNGTPLSGFVYPNFVAPPANQGVATSVLNVPLEWYNPITNTGIIEDLNSHLQRFSEELTEPIPVGDVAHIGDAGAKITMHFDNPISSNSPIEESQRYCFGVSTRST